MQIPQENALGEMRPNEPGWDNRGRGRRFPRITGALMSTACTRMPGARAAAFADKAALKTAGSRPPSSSSRSRRGTSTLVPSIGTFVRATLVAPVVFGSFVMQPVMGVILNGKANCDASAAIANGALNDCTSSLADGSECTPICHSGYTLSGIRSCSGGTIVDTAVCIPSPYEHGRRLLQSSQWAQVGADIDGEAGSDQSGYSVSMSSDGKRVAIGAVLNSGSFSYAGHVRVYAESGGTWTQVGSDIDGEAFGDSSGASVSMSSDGTRVAIGAPLNTGTASNAGHVRVYAESGGTWTQVGDDINGEAFGDSSGTSVSMSSDGTRVAIGAPYNGNNAGHVRVYAESGGTWTQVGNDIDGEAAGDESGTSVSMSSDGKRVAIGAPLNSGSAGHVRVYAESGGVWTQVGSDIDGEAAGDGSGTSVSMSSDGTRVAIGAPENGGNDYGSYAGHVRVYAESGGTWTQVGADINGEAASDGSGYSVSMSSDGKRVAIGAYQNDGTGSNAGHVRLYAESGGTWTQMGSDIDGEATYDQSGYSVSMSSDGTRVAIGADQNTGTTNAGHVRVFGQSCDASTAPTNGAVGTCTSSLASGLTCQPTCNSGYTVSGVSSCSAGTLTAATCSASSCDVSSAPANGGKGDCGNLLAKSQSCTPTCNDGYVRKGNKKTSCSSAGVLSAAECRKRYSWGDAKFCPKYENNMFCQFVKTEADCLAASSKRNCKWSSSGSGYCYDDDAEFDEMIDESQFHDFAGEKCESLSPYTRDACVAVSGCGWFEGSGGYCILSAKESVKKILSDTGAPPGVSKYWNEWWHDACWYLTKSTCTTSTTVTGCVLDNGDGCTPGPAKSAVYGADGCAGHADFEAVAALGGTTVAEARDKFKVKSAKEQAEETRDSILAGITDESLKRKAKLLADAAIGGNAVKKLTAKLEAATPTAACALYYSKAGIADSLGACVATAAASGKRRRLAAAAYDVEVFFSSAEITDTELTKARDALKAAGIEATLDENVDPIAELKTINGVDASAVDTFKTQSTAAAAAVEKSPPPPPPPPNPPPAAKAGHGRHRRDAEVGSGKRGVRERVRVPDRRDVRVKSSRASERLRVHRLCKK